MGEAYKTCGEGTGAYRVLVGMSKGESLEDAIVEVRIILK
jgi:hypothetical protein